MTSVQTFDATWRARALAGDEAAAAALAESYLEPLYRLAFHRVDRRRDLAEEVVQETLVRAHTDLARYEPARCGDDPWPWLGGLLRNEVRRVLARERRVTLGALWDALDEELAAAYAKLESAPLAEETLAREETRALVDVTLSQLPPQYREALEAKYLLGRSVRAMAEAWRTTEKTVESRLTRARAAFRVTFEALARFGVDAGQVEA